MADTTDDQKTQQDQEAQVQSQIDKSSEDSQFKVGDVPYHTHSGTDSPRIKTTALENFPRTPAQGDVIYYNAGTVTVQGNQWVNLAAGTAGFYLQTTGTSCLWANPSKFGGTGSDGSLTLSSGTTTINLNNAKVVTKNYTNISITGTGGVTFSNPYTGGSILILKSQGNVDLTSSSNSINAIGMGAIGGTGGAAGVPGSNGTIPVALFFGGTPAGLGGNPGSGGTGGASVAGGNMILLPDAYLTQTAKSIFLVGGAGGGGGGGGTVAGTTPPSGGTGGRGGGAAYVECGGTLNFTGKVAVAGANGATPANTADGGDNGGGGSGGGGGGGGGMFYILYNSLSANTGTVNFLGGTGGSGGNGGTGNAVNNSGGSGGSGGSGAGSFAGDGGTSGTGGNRSSGSGQPGGAGGAGGIVGGSNGANGGQQTGAQTPSGGGGSGGGGGGGGGVLIEQNTNFA